MHTNAVSRRAPGALSALIGIGMLKDEKRDTEHRVCPAQSWFYIGEVCFLKRVGHCSVLLLRIKSGHLKRGLRQDVKQFSILKCFFFDTLLLARPSQNERVRKKIGPDQIERHTRMARATRMWEQLLLLSNRSRHHQPCSKDSGKTQNFCSLRFTKVLFSFFFFLNPVWIQECRCVEPLRMLLLALLHAQQKRWYTQILGCSTCCNQN